MARNAQQFDVRAVMPPVVAVPTCTICGGLVTAHFDARGQWAGCQPTIAPSFALVHDRRQAQPAQDTRPTFIRQALESSLVRTKPATAGNGHTKPSARAAKRATDAARAEILSRPTQPARVLYVASYGVRDPKAKRISSERDREVLATIARARNGISRADLLRAMKVGTRTGVVDGAVRRLRLRKAISTRIVTEA